LRELGTPTRIGDNGHGLVLELGINISRQVKSGIRRRRYLRTPVVAITRLSY
jgi:hypothetical protein